MNKHDIKSRPCIQIWSLNPTPHACLFLVRTNEGGFFPVTAIFYLTGCAQLWKWVNVLFRKNMSWNVLLTPTPLTQGSLKDSGNLVYALILTAQVLHALHEHIKMLWIAENRGTASMAHVSNSPWAEDTVSSWVQTKSNWWLDWKRFLCLMVFDGRESTLSFHPLQGLHSLTCSPRSGRFGLLGQEKKRIKKHHSNPTEREVEPRFSGQHFGQHSHLRRCCHSLRVFVSQFRDVCCLMKSPSPVSSCEGGQYQTVCHPFGSSVRILKQMTSRAVNMFDVIRCDLDRFVMIFLCFVLFVFVVLTLQMLWLRTSAKRAWSLSSCHYRRIDGFVWLMWVEPHVRPCPHQSPQIRSIYVACGEHDICTWPVGFLRCMRDFGWFCFVQGNWASELESKRKTLIYWNIDFGSNDTGSS